MLRLLTPLLHPQLESGAEAQGSWSTRTERTQSAHLLHWSPTCTPDYEQALSQSSTSFTFICFL